jgi:hypothetical protein
MVPRSLRVIVVVLIVSAGFSGVGFAQADDPAWSDALYEELAPMADAYNENVDTIDLGIAGDQLKERYTNLYVSGPGGTAVYSFYMDSNLRMSDLSDAPNPDARLRMSTDKATVERIADASNPAAAFRTAVKADAIVITGEDGHPIEKIKWAVLNFLKGLLL